MFTTYYVINYIYTIDDIVQSKISSKAYDNIEEAEDELRQNGFIDMRDLNWYNTFSTDERLCVEAHIYLTTSKYSDYMVLK